MSVSNPQSSGSQDSIDLDTILVRYREMLSSPVFPIEDTAWKATENRKKIDSATEYAKTALTAWHNTQLKAAIPKKRVDPHKGNIAYGETVGYNQAIDDITANLEKL